MLFHTQTLALAALFSTLVAGRPLDSAGSHNIVARGKSYSVVNVGGDSTTETPPRATSVVETTTTVEVALPGKTITREVTATVAPAPPPPAPTTSCSSSSSVAKPSSSSPSVSSTSISASSTPRPSAPPAATPTPSMSASSNNTSTPIQTPKPIFITVTVPGDDGPTEYYDNGQWHTSYKVKTFDAAVAATPLPAV